mgnify:CR=1 FL=1
MIDYDLCLIIYGMMAILSIFVFIPTLLYVRFVRKACEVLGVDFDRIERIANKFLLVVTLSVVSSSIYSLEPRTSVYVNE